MTYQINMHHMACCSAEFEMEDGKKWEDIKEFYIKWGVLHYTFDGEVWQSEELDIDYSNDYDTKRPELVEVIEDADDEYKIIARQEG